VNTAEGQRAACQGGQPGYSPLPQQAVSQVTAEANLAIEVNHAITGNFVQLCAELAERDIDCARDMPKLVFLRTADIQDQAARCPGWKIFGVP
jgi:hypothetical protein